MKSKSRAQTIMAEKGKNNSGHWQHVQLRYADGFQMSVILDKPSVRRIESGDTALMETIRNNLQSANVNTPVDRHAEDANVGKVSDAKNIQTENPEHGEGEYKEKYGDSEVELNKPSHTYVNWSREANEEDLENPRNQKKQIWKLITMEMNKAGYQFSQNKVGSKWRSLVQSHKSVQDKEGGHFNTTKRWMNYWPKGMMLSQLIQLKT